MARASLVFRPDDPQPEASLEHRQLLSLAFDRFTAIFGSPEIPGSAAGFAIAARAPKFALLLSDLSDYMVSECEWTAQRTDLRELSIQALNLHFGCEFNFQSHLAKAEQRFGLPVELQAAIPYWKTSNIFTPEQRLVIEYTFAACEGTVTDELFARVAAQFGEGGALEFTFGIAWWSFWAILVGAIAPQHDFGYGKPSRE